MSKSPVQKIAVPEGVQSPILVTLEGHDDPPAAGDALRDGRVHE